MPGMSILLEDVQPVTENKNLSLECKAQSKGGQVD